MRRVHRRLRGALQLAQEQLEDDGAFEPPTRDRLRQCWGFCQALGGHHRGENQVPFPLLVAAHPPRQPVGARLVQEPLDDQPPGARSRGGPQVRGHAGETSRHLDGVSAIMDERLGPLA